MKNWINVLYEDYKTAYDQSSWWCNADISIEELIEIISDLKTAEDRLNAIVNSSGSETLQLHNTRSDKRLELIDEIIKAKKENK